MKNFLNIIIIVFLTVIFMNLFSNPNTKKEGLNISFSSKEYTVPASLKVDILNNWKEEVSLNTCKDIIIRKSWEEIKFTDKDICKDIKVPVWKSFTQDYQKEYKKFLETWPYSLEVNLPWNKKFTWETQVVNKWAFSKLFTTLIYAPIYNLFIFLINIFNHSLGWAIIAITIIVRLILVYPQHKAMVSQRKLQELHPTIKKIQEENKWNQQAIWMKIFELYKKEKINPFGSMWFLFIQLPIILVLYNVILSVTDVSNSYYLYDFLNWFKVSSINENFYWLDLLKAWWIQWLILALVVWIIQFFQIKLSIMFNKVDKKPENTVVLEKKAWENDYTKMMPDQDTMNKFMLYVLPIMIAFATYAFFAWVWIYFAISTLFMLVQQAIVNKMSKKSTQVL